MRIRWSMAAWMLVAGLACAPRLLASPRLRVALTPARQLPWSQVLVSVTIENPEGPTIYPLSLELHASTGLVRRWAYRGSHSFSSPHRGVNKGSDLQVLVWNRPVPQVGPIPRGPTTTLTLHELRPLRKGGMLHTGRRLVASYDHSGPLMLVFRYLLVSDPSSLGCVVEDWSQKRQQQGFHDCRRSASRDAIRFVRAGRWKPNRKVEQRVELAIERPRFDLADARQRTGVRSGAVGYDRRHRRWILVDKPHHRTLVVSRRGTLDLPGDWLEELSLLNSERDTTLQLSLESDAEYRRQLRRFRQAGLRPRPADGKGDLALAIRVDWSNLHRVAKALRRLGYRVSGGLLVKH